MQLGRFLGSLGRFFYSLGRLQAQLVGYLSGTCRVLGRSCF